MSITNINLNDLSNDDPMRDLLQDMNRKEEQCLIDHAKRSLANGTTTPQEVHIKFIKFMALWAPGKREFILIPEYLRTLNVE